MRFLLYLALFFSCINNGCSRWIHGLFFTKLLVLVLHQFICVLFAGIDLVYCKEIIFGIGIQILITFIPMFPNNSFVVEALCFQFVYLMCFRCVVKEFFWGYTLLVVFDQNDYYFMEYSIPSQHL